MNKRRARELEMVMRQRGEITREQKEYAKVELRAIKEIYPLIEPSKELRPPNTRTLESYIDDQVFSEIMHAMGVRSLNFDSLSAVEF